MRCDQVRDLMSEFLDGELPAGLAQSVEEHLAQCASCAAELSAWQRANRLVAEHMPSLEPPAALWVGISNRIIVERPPTLLEKLARQWKLAFAAGVAVVAILTLLLVYFPSPAAGGISKEMLQAQMEQYLKDRGNPHQAINPFLESDTVASPEITENPFSRYIRLEYQNPFEEME
jgi:anti-sigma factor RsiW